MIEKRSIRILIGVVLAILPIIYAKYTGISWHPLKPREHLVQNGMGYVLLLLFSYVNHIFLVPRWFLIRQYGRYALIAISCISIVAYLPHRIEQWCFFTPPPHNTPIAWVRQFLWEEMMLKEPPGVPSRSSFEKDAPGSPDDPAFTNRKGNLLNPPFGPGLSGKLAIFFLLGSVSTLLSVSILMASRIHQIENDHLRAELRQLKAQIHPHFLFNTLNSIYSLSIRQDERTPETIVKLSEFMRYLIRDAHREYVPLVTEINYLTNYIDLQKARLQDAVVIDYRLEGNGSRLQIAPLLLFSFIENAFKYGVNPEEDSLIVIHLTIQQSELQLYVANNKVEVNQLEPSTGVGLANSQDRLRLLYPDTHRLTIDNTPAYFRVNLFLSLT